MLDQTATFPARTSPADATGPRGETRGLCFAVAGRRLIDGIDLELEPGRLTIVMGPNGSGKSLLLRLLHGLIEPTAGSVTWDGQPPTDAVRSRQAMVFQRPVLLRRSVEANLRFVLGLRGPVSRRKTSDMLAFVGLSAQAKQPARLLSGGEQQRLALARALVLEPGVLFLDEPTASLDPASTAAIEDIVLAAHARGTRVVFVTHDLGQARRLADEVVFLDRGRLAEFSPALQFFDTPASDVARDYVAGRLPAPA